MYPFWHVCFVHKSLSIQLNFIRMPYKWEVIIFGFYIFPANKIWSTNGQFSMNMESTFLISGTSQPMSYILDTSWNLLVHIFYFFTQNTDFLVLKLKVTWYNLHVILIVLTFKWEINGILESCGLWSWIFFLKSLIE